MGSCGFAYPRGFIEKETDIFLQWHYLGFMFMYTEPHSSKQHSRNSLGKKERERDMNVVGELVGKRKRVSRNRRRKTVGEYEHSISCIHVMYNQSIYADKSHLLKNLHAEQVAHLCSGPVGAGMALLE